MGVDSKKSPPLPAPTEDSESTVTKLSDSAPSDIDKNADEKSSYSLPEDGTPVTIKTRTGHMSNKSQTSLLIEYFEGGKVTTTPGSSGTPPGDRKPSVRVRLTPSKNRKNDRIQITETKSSSGRKASLSRRQDRASPLTPTQAKSEDALSVMSGDAEDAKSMNSYQSATEESNVSRNPIEVEIDRSGRHRRRRPASPLIPAADSKASYQTGNMSEISAIPTDSFLDGSGPSSRYDERRSKSPSRAREVIGGAAAGLAAAAVADKMRSKSRSDLTDKERVIMSKSRDRDRSERRQKSKQRKSSASSDHHSESGKSSRKKSSKTNEESLVSGVESSVLSSAISGSHRSGDASSMRSGTSRYSINNPKLLETVEDAIRRLILPELVAIKREQSKREARRSSASSETTLSKDGTSSERRHSGYSSKSRETLGRRVVSRDRETGRHELLESPAPSVDQDSVDESLHEIEHVSHSDNKLKAAGAGAGAGALAAAVMHEGSAREQRRRRRAEARSRQSDRYAAEDDDGPAAPMPLMMSEISPSEITRTSILSAETERPHSATDELTPIQRVHKGTPSLESTSTTRTSSPTPTKNSSGLQTSLGLQHANLSHGDLRTLPQRRTGGLEEEYEPEYGRRQMIREQDLDDEDDYDDPAYNNYYSTQEVPPPLKYVPYQPERRGLSPIPSVSGYTEGGSEVNQRSSRISQRTSDSYPSPSKSHRRGAESPSLLSQASFRDDRSIESSRAGYRNTTYTDDSELDRIRSGQDVRALGANPGFVNSPNGAESHVASLVEGSALDSVLTGESGHSGPYRGNRASAEAAALLGGAPRLNEVASSREQTPEPSRAVEDDTVSEMSEDPESHQSQQYDDEYDLDQYGRKIPRSEYRQSPTTEAVITGAAVGAAAAALRAAAKGKGKQVSEDAWTGEGVQRNKSFKDRTREGHLPANTPSHSVDRLVDPYEKPNVGHSGLPDTNDPMPEIGFYGHDDDELTNPSRMSDRMSATQEASNGHWQDDEPTTPTQESVHARHGLTVEEAAGAAAVATAAALAHSHSRKTSEEVDGEWYRTSEDRKRDTIVTNPYEGTSPLANAPGLSIELPSGAPRFDPHIYDQYDSRSPFGPKVDEGYISQGPNRTPDIKATAYNSQTPPLLPNLVNPYLNRQDPDMMSGMDQGMGSPMYEAATGTGIERIESKDIIALMQHLMVRDAQRSARDTEILHTLVQTASEMRNSFDGIRKMVAESEDVTILEIQGHTEKTMQSYISGPRPFPGSGARSFQTGSQGGTDQDKKTRNLWRRAIKGLSSKGTNDLTRIEDMLMQLLGEVDVLKAQTAHGRSGGPSLDNMQPAVQYEQDRGYEPEGHAGTSTASYASQSGHLSIPRNPSAKSGYERKVSGSGQRISTVPEGDEEDHYDDSNVVVHNRSGTDMMSPVQEIARVNSVPLATPPQLPAGGQASLSSDNTPRDSKGKKHKSSGSSSWFPKISRWSETTASSLGKPFRKSNVTDANSFHGPSRSASDLGEYDEYPGDGPYNGDQLHTGFSSTHLHPQSQRQDPNQIETGSADMAFTLAGVSRTPVPPSEHDQDDQDQDEDSEDDDELPQISPFLKHYGTPEDPKYKAHRNSLNLQHPQPRQGQTEHFRTLETTAQEFSPLSPASAEWAGSVNSLTRFTPGASIGQQSRFSNGIDTTSQGQYTWEGRSSPNTTASVSGGPPRPPKEPLERGAQSPVQRGVTPSRSRISNLAYKPAGSPKPENRNLSNVIGPPARRPSGPRAMGTRSPAPEGEERRKKRDTFGTVGSSEQDSDTF